MLKLVRGGIDVKVASRGRFTSTLGKIYRIFFSRKDKEGDKYKVFIEGGIESFVKFIEDNNIKPEDLDYDNVKNKLTAKNVSEKEKNIYKTLLDYVESGTQFSVILKSRDGLFDIKGDITYKMFKTHSKDKNKGKIPDDSSILTESESARGINSERIFKFNVLREYHKNGELNNDENTPISSKENDKGVYVTFSDQYPGFYKKSSNDAVEHNIANIPGVVVDENGKIPLFYTNEEGRLKDGEGTEKGAFNYGGKSLSFQDYYTSDKQSLMINGEVMRGSVFVAVNKDRPVLLKVSERQLNEKDKSFIKAAIKILNKESSNVLNVALADHEELYDLMNDFDSAFLKKKQEDAGEIGGLITIIQAIQHVTSLTLRKEQTQGAALLPNTFEFVGDNIYFAYNGQSIIFNEENESKFDEFINTYKRRSVNVEMMSDNQEFLFDNKIIHSNVAINEFSADSEGNVSVKKDLSQEETNKIDHNNTPDRTTYSIFDIDETGDRKYGSDMYIDIDAKFSEGIPTEEVEEAVKESKPDVPYEQKEEFEKREIIRKLKEAINNYNVVDDEEQIFDIKDFQKEIGRAEFESFRKYMDNEEFLKDFKDKVEEELDCNRP